MDNLSLWIGFNLFVIAMLAIDLFVFHREAHEVRVREAAAWSIAWVALALLFGAGVYTWMGRERGLEYFAGYDFQNYSGRDDVLLIAQRTERVNALFGQIRTAPELIDRTTLALGVRYNNASNSDDATVWNLSGRYDFTPAFFARAGVGTAFRYPDAYQLFAIDDSCCIGNPNLKPERSTNVEAGADVRLADGRLTLSGTVFRQRFRDLIRTVGIEGTSQQTNRNIGASSARGSTSSASVAASPSSS